MTRRGPALFRGRHFEDVLILLCVRWYLRFSLTYRDLEEIMAERVGRDPSDITLLDVYHLRAGGCVEVETRE